MRSAALNFRPVPVPAWWSWVSNGSAPPPDAVDFYHEHRTADPRHGADWLDHVVVHFEADDEWAHRMVRGARWRSAVNHAFFEAMGHRFLDA